MPAAATTAAAAATAPPLRQQATMPTPRLPAHPVALTHAADACDSGADLGSAELEARRTQQLVDWGTLLVQAAATVAAERVLLGPAAPPVSQAGLEWWFGMAGLGSLLLL